MASAFMYPGHFRISYATDTDSLREACTRIQRFCQGLQLTAMPGFASRLERARVAAAVALTTRARELREAGANVIQLTIGEPDFATPPHAIEAAHAAALRGETKYPPQDGTRALKEAVQRKFQRDHGLDYALDQILVGNGGKQVIFDALLATVEAGDEVLIPTPFWSSYSLMTHVVGGTPTFVSCPQNNGFRLRPEDLDAAITPRTRWLLLNFPNNPSGAACSRADLAAIGAVMREASACLDPVRRHVRASRL